jgi:predicted glycosyltransferase/glycosyltransferase involved in cell wall biosynthesis
MRIHYHIIVGSIDPVDVGIGKSTIHIPNLLVDLGNSRASIYTLLRDVPSFNENVSDKIRVYPIAEMSDRLLEPIESTSLEQKKRENFRIDYLLIKDLIEKQLLENATCSHLILSFSVSTSGFIGQQLADELHLPHIASIRGTDFSRDFHDPLRMPGIAYVLLNAEHIITTNKTQQNVLRPFIGNNTRTTTIYNSISDDLLDYHWTPHKRTYVRILADCGFSSEKATQVLINSVLRLRSEGLEVVLCIVGTTKEDKHSFWVKELKKITEPSREIERVERCTEKQFATMLLEADLYCSVSLGEDSSNSAILALSTGIPMMVTSTGILPDLVNGASHVTMSPPGNEEDFFVGLRKSCTKILNNEMAVSQSQIEYWKNLFSEKQERIYWERVVQDTIPRRRPMKPLKQPRVLFFAHDGTGLGHLKRLSHLAEAIQGPCACLMVTGHSATSLVIPETIEFVHLPSHDNLLPDKASYWGREPFLKLDRDHALAFRRQMLESVVNDFEPDIIVVDYLPLGHHSELKAIISKSPAQKYFIMRGVLDVPGNVRLDLLWGEAERALQYQFKKLLVAGDIRVCDIIKEYELRPEIADKVEYIGYVSAPLLKRNRDRIRTERGLSSNDLWVVCSAGGGEFGEEFIRECERLSCYFPDIYFDIIFGPRANSEWPFCSGDIFISGKTRYLRGPRNLGKLHGSADIIISTGGYNSMVEAMEGSATIICSPSQKRKSGEQYTHASRLREFYPIEIAEEPSQIKRILQEIISTPREKVNIRSVLDFSGIEKFREILFNDLGIEFHQ